MENNVLDHNLGFESTEGHELLQASEEYLSRARMWAFLGGIGGIILGHKLAYGTVWKNGEVLPVYNQQSRDAGKRIQRIGLSIWLPLYGVFLFFYLSFVLSF